MTSPRAARLAAALAAAAAVVVVVLPGRRAALAAPFNPRSSYGFSPSSSYDFYSDSDFDSVDHRPAALAAPSGNFPADDVDYMGAAPFNHESVSHSLQPDGPLIEDKDGVGFMNFPADDVDYMDAAPFDDERMYHSLQSDGPLPEDDLGFMKERLKAHLDLAEAAMVEAAQSIHGDEPEAKSRYQRFFKKRLLRLIDLTIEKFPESGYQAAIKRYKGAFRVKLEEIVESLVYAKDPMPYSLPSNFKRWTVAKWIMSFAHSECSKSGRKIRNIDDFYERIKGNDLYQQDPDHSQFWNESRQILGDLNNLVKTIKNMANEFVKMLQADGKSTEQGQSVMYDLYTEDFLNIRWKSAVDLQRQRILDYPNRSTGVVFP